jgi:hypothetical protein
LTADDRLAISDLLIRYATAIDNRRWDLLDAVFVEDAHLDYRSAGGVAAAYPEARRWLEEVLPVFDVTQHHIFNTVVHRSGGTVHATSNFLNVNTLEIGGGPWIFTVGGRYHDRLTLASGRWRIRDRIEETLWWDHPMPGLPAAPEPVEGLLDGVVTQSAEEAGPSRRYQSRHGVVCRCHTSGPRV